MADWLRDKIEPDLVHREAAAMVMQAQIVLMESHTWPLMEMKMPR